MPQQNIEVAVDIWEAVWSWEIIRSLCEIAAFLGCLLKNRMGTERAGVSQGELWFVECHDLPPFPFRASLCRELFVLLRLLTDSSEPHVHLVSEELAQGCQGWERFRRDAFFVLILLVVPNAGGRMPERFCVADQLVNCFGVGREVVKWELVTFV